MGTIKALLRISGALFAITIAVLPARGTPDIIKNSQGIQFSSNQWKVSVSMASLEAFELEVNAVADSGLHNPFVDPQASRSAPAWEMVENKGWIGIRSKQGALLVDAAKQCFALSGPDGREVVTGTFASKPSMSLGKEDRAKAGPKKSPYVSFRLKSPKMGKAYGCGDLGTDDTTLSTSNSLGQANGNGNFRQAYAWNSAGFVSSVIGQDPVDGKSQAEFVISDKEMFWQVPGSGAALYLAVAPTLKDGMGVYRNLFGPAPVPPLWTFGFMASKWGWKLYPFIEETAKHFKDGHFPVDSFIYDFEWYTKTPDYKLKPAGEENFPDFAFNAQLFPEPEKQIDALHAQGIRSVMIRKPRLGDASTLREFREKGWTTKGGKGYESRNIDYNNPAVRDWYAQKTSPMLKQGIDAWWNDEGEQDYLMNFNWNLAEIAAQESVKPGQRFWSLNRAGALGMQRTGAVLWTGDIKDSDLAVNIVKKLKWSASGHIYHGDDIGGFFCKNLTPALLTRWYQAGAFFPIMRAHSHSGMIPHWPWLWDDKPVAGADPNVKTSDRLRNALNLRYRLIPYLYSLAYRAYETGLPIMEPVVLEHPEMPGADSLVDQWMCGPKLMVAPILDGTSVRRTVKLPEGIWYRFQTPIRVKTGTFKAEANMDEIPVYAEAGAIIPLGPVVENTSQSHTGPLELQVYAGSDGQFTMVEDDGTSNNYLRGDCRKTTFTWNDKTHSLSWTSEGAYDQGNLFHEMLIKVFTEDGKTVTRNASLGERHGTVQF
ncbi:MAG: glycoside hydrolase family 31 protein [Proteobacteria bacterium]|nr:glycoside hydrolase family 31 protein [Pseudomonadota bacterium]